VTETTVWQCPNCGSIDFFELALDRRQCTYCGTTMAAKQSPEAESQIAATRTVECSRCDAENEPLSRCFLPRSLGGRR